MISTINGFINKPFIKQLLKTNVKYLSTNKTSDFESDFLKVLENEKQFQELSVDSFKELSTDPQLKDKIEVILSEYEYTKYTTLQVPTTISTDQMKDLLSLKSPEDRKRWISYLYKRENARLKSNQKRKEHSEEYWTQKREIYAKSAGRRTGIWDNNHELNYGLWHNTLFSKIRINQIKQHFCHRLRNAALFGQKLVIDLDFDEYMKLSETRLLVQQIHLLYNYNKYKTQVPFDLYFTNCKPSMPTMQAIPKWLPKYNSNDFFASFETKSYSDLFPKEKLVYLSPHSNKTLNTYNCDDIYIIGGIVDKSYREHITYVKAEKEGIRSARLPIDDYVLWGSGSKYLCLNHVIAILHDMSIHGDWSKALKENIPQRKQKSAAEVEYEDMLRKQKYKRNENQLKQKNH